MTNHPMPWSVVEETRGLFNVHDAEGRTVVRVTDRAVAHLIAAAPKVFYTARQLLTGLNAQTIAGLDVGFQNTRNELQADLDRGTIR